MMIRSVPCRPEVIRSSSVKPVARPGEHPLPAPGVLDDLEVVARRPGRSARSRPGSRPRRCRRSRRWPRPSRASASCVPGEAVAHDPLARPDEPPERRLLLDDPRVVLDVADVGNAVEQRRQVGGAADLLDRARAVELFLEREHVDLGGALGELDHRVVDAAVRVREEVVARQDGDDEGERRADRAESRRGPSVRPRDSAGSVFSAVTVVEHCGSGGDSGSASRAQSIGSRISACAFLPRRGATTAKKISFPQSRTFPQAHWAAGARTDDVRASARASGPARDAAPRASPHRRRRRPGACAPRACRGSRCPPSTRDRSSRASAAKRRSSSGP